jgi:hypothetical protein
MPSPNSQLPTTPSSDQLSQKVEPHQALISRARERAQGVQGVGPGVCDTNNVIQL